MEALQAIESRKSARGYLPKPAEDNLMETLAAINFPIPMRMK
jgi:hypothetical protein